MYFTGPRVLCLTCCVCMSFHVCACVFVRVCLLASASSCHRHRAHIHDGNVPCTMHTAAPVIMHDKSHNSHKLSQSEKYTLVLANVCVRSTICFFSSHLHPLAFRTSPLSFRTPFHLFMLRKMPQQVHGGALEGRLHWQQGKEGPPAFQQPVLLLVVLLLVLLLLVVLPFAGLFGLHCVRMPWEQTCLHTVPYSVCDNERSGGECLCTHGVYICVWGAGLCRVVGCIATVTRQPPPYTHTCIPPHTHIPQ